MRRKHDGIKKSRFEENTENVNICEKDENTRKNIICEKNGGVKKVNTRKKY